MFAGYFITFNKFECHKFELTSMHKVPTCLQFVDMWHLSLLSISEVWFKQRIVGFSIITILFHFQYILLKAGYSVFCRICFEKYYLERFLSVVMLNTYLWLMCLCSRGLWWVWFIVKLQASGHASVNYLLLAISKFRRKR